MKKTSKESGFLSVSTSKTSAPQSFQKTVTSPTIIQRRKSLYHKARGEIRSDYLCRVCDGSSRGQYHSVGLSITEKANQYKLSRDALREILKTVMNGTIVDHGEPS